MPDILVPTHMDQLPEAFLNPSGNLLRPNQMVETKHEIDETRRSLDNPKIEDKGAVRKRLREMSRQYEVQAPRPLTDGHLKDSLKKEADQLLTTILPGMLSQEEMRKNPAGSVDKHIRWERANKAKIVRWKKIQCLLNADTSAPQTWDRDAANLERFRPEGAHDRLRLDAQIAGHMSYGTVPEENWVRAFGPSKLADAQQEQGPFSIKPSPEVVPSDEKATESALRKK